MRRPTARGCAGALAAVAAGAAALVLPAPLRDGRPMPRIETFISSACGGASPCPSPDRLRWLGDLEVLLSERMPEAAEAERFRLAEAIYEEARAAAIDPLLVLALIAVESGFEHDAESEAGARGLMQLRPETLRREAERSNLAGEPDDPILNVRAGIRYYLRLVRAFGQRDLALMAYNAGPNRLLRLLSEESGIPEHIQAYPRRVQRELGRLQRRLGTTAPPLALAGRGRAEREAPAAR